MFSYSGDPADSDKDAVRFLAQQTDENTSYVDDEEILWALTQESGIYNAAALVCETIAVRLAQLSKSWVRGRIEQKQSNTPQYYRDLAREYRSRANSAVALFSGSAFAGGISVDQKATEEANADRVSPRFYRGQFE